MIGVTTVGMVFALAACVLIPQANGIASATGAGCLMVAIVIAVYCDTTGKP